MMQNFSSKHFYLTVFLAVMVTMPAAAQQNKAEQEESPFIQQGDVLTGFSLGFTNASTGNYNFEFPREVSRLSIQIDGLYFVSNHIGVGPLLGYQFTYRDLEDPYTAGDTDVRRWQFEFGAQSGWYMPLKSLFGGSGDSQFFVDAGISWLRDRFEEEGVDKSDPEYSFGYQLGAGFLFPVGRQIAIETKLGFQARQQEYRFAHGTHEGITHTTETKWREEVALSVGLKVVF